MRYVVWHVERSGSNYLMNLLSKTGLAGINDYPNCGFYIGFEALSEGAFDALVTEYFAKQATGEIAGCKASLSYMEVIEATVSWQAALRWFESFDKHIVLKRYDTIAQAVSFYFAGTTKRYTSESVSKLPEPEYDFAKIALIQANIAGRYERLGTFLETMGKNYRSIYYEDILEDRQNEANEILRYLGIPEKVYIPEADIEKQVSGKKTEYIERFKAECKSIS